MIGKLERVPLREVWAHEAYDFTQWLEQNIDVVNDALGLDIVSIDREQAAGKFSIDLVGEDQAGRKLVIENQLEKSDHDHLGKLITYLTAMQAHAAIWIVRDPRPEHVAAIGRLNQALDADFYMVKVEAVRISTSPAAPLFTLISGPSQEAKDVGMARKEFAERYAIRNRWWSQLIERSKAKTRLHAHITPGDSSWIGVSSGFRGLGFNYTVKQDSRTAELWIDRGKGAEAENLTLFKQLRARQQDIDQAFGQHLQWEGMDGKRSCVIRCTLNDGGYRSPDEDWPRLQDQQIDAMIRLERALKPVILKLKGER
jgi:hypothetical protein